MENRFSLKKLFFLKIQIYHMAGKPSSSTDHPILQKIAKLNIEIWDFLKKMFFLNPPAKENYTLHFSLMETISTLINNKTNKESQISILRFGILNKRQLGHREHPEPGPWSPKRPRTRGANDCWHAPKPKNISTLNIETRDFLFKKMFFLNPPRLPWLTSHH